MMRLLSLLLAFVATSAAFADAPSFEERFWVLYGFSLNDVSLQDVQKRLGPARIFDAPEGHYERALCYTTSDPSIIVVFSSGELGGGKQLLGVSLERASLHHYSCSASSSALPPEFPMGLHLGMSEQDFLKTAGVPFEKVDSKTLRRQGSDTLKRPISRAESDKRYGDAEITKFIQENGGMDVSQVFWVTIDQNKVVALGVWKEETF